MAELKLLALSGILIPVTPSAHKIVKDVKDLAAKALKCVWPFS